MKLNFIIAFAILCASAQAAVQVLRVPDGGIQPQVATGPDGVAHLVYYKGKDAAGDLFYTRLEPGATNFAPVLRINSQPGAAIAAGTIRGAHIALGKEGVVHVIWNGGQGAKKVVINGEEAVPLLYTRVTDGGTKAEPERNLITTASVLDGGSSVAADSNGNVFAVWHAAIPGKPHTEANRAVFIARSTDNGKTFATETQSAEAGVCACCGLRAFTSGDGATFVLYRAARSLEDRPAVLLASAKPGEEFRIINSHPWNIAACPMSSASLANSTEGALAAWETAGQVYFASIDPKRLSVSQPISPAGKIKRKHPALAANKRGEVLLAWTEGTAWAKGGSVSWQIFSAEGRPKSELASLDGLPAWSFPAVLPKANGDFALIY